MHPEVSIIITAHREGILLHKTVLSMLRSATHLEKNNIKYEFILSVDNPDQSTLNYVRRWQNDERFIVSEVSFGNPSDNRNSAIKLAKGTYIALMDGDDLISESWLSSAYQLIKQQASPTILRPAAHIQFGYDEENLTAWFMRDSSSREADAIQMAYWNLWTNVLFAPKKVLLENPYREAGHGFGFEDYLFNADTRAKNIAHIVVPETALFYRRRAFSVTTSHMGTILGYSNLFDISFMKSIPINQSASPKQTIEQKVKSTGRRVYRFAFDTAKRIGPVNRALSPLARNILSKKKEAKLPVWFINEWKNINSIENQLWPTRGEIAKFQFHPLTADPYHSTYGHIYHQLCHAISADHLDYLFLAPEMSGRGGTEKLIHNYITALKKVHPDWKIGILSTQPFNHDTLDYFSKTGVDMLDFGGLTKGVGDYEKDIIWSRILIQSKVKRLHIVNDAHWYRWITRHQRLMIENNYKVYVSLFMREYVHEKGRVLSFADPDLMQIWPTVTKVFTDNRRVIDDALENNAFEDEKMTVHYQPQTIDKLVKPKTIEKNNNPVRILWASRISHQKRPDILKKIANKLDDRFTVDAYGIIEKRQYSQDYFSDSKVHYRGTFNGISSIPTHEYDIYLYTSQTDGVPNILMEVSAAGLPIVASNIGGVGEFVKDNKTGLLADMEDIAGYIKAIKRLIGVPEEARTLASNAQKLIESQHSWDEFIKKVKKDIT